MKLDAAKAKLWKGRVLDYRRSGLGRLAWCKKTGFSRHSLDYWLREEPRVGAQEPRVGAQERRTGIGEGLSRICVVPEQAEPGLGVDVRIKFSGIELEFLGLRDATWVSQVLREFVR